MNTLSATKYRYALAVLVSFCCLSEASAAERQFVGVLAVAVEDDVARELGLTPEQKAKLIEVIDSREAEVVEQALELRDLPPSVQEQRLAPFRQKSEELGMAALTPGQQSLLRRIDLRLRGFASLGDPEVAKQLSLSDEQRRSVAALLKQRDERIHEADDATRRSIITETERQLSTLITDQQRGAWDTITARGVSAPALPSAPVGEDPIEAPLSPADPDAADPVAEEAGVDELLGGPIADPLDDPSMGYPLVEDPSLEDPIEDSLDALFQEMQNDPPVIEPSISSRDSKIRFNFRYQPWKDVLEMFAEEAGLSLVFEDLPKGTCNCTDKREYTPGEAIDRLNGLLLGKGYVLLRRQQTLFVVNLDDGIPDVLIPTVELEDLDERGEYELVRVVFDLEKFLPEEAEMEIAKFLREEGRVVALPKSKQVLVTETAGRMRLIRKMIQRVEDPEGLGAGDIRTFKPENIPLDDAMAVLRQLLDMPEDSNTSGDGLVRIALTPSGDSLLVTGNQESIAKVANIMKEIDVPRTGPIEIVEEQQLEVYRITNTDIETAMAILQTLMADSPDVRIASDATAGNLVVLAKPSEHRTIRAVIEQLQGDAPKIEVIFLATLDPMDAIYTINAAFGGTEEEPAEDAPQVSAGVGIDQLIVRGTEAQIEQVRELLGKLGEDPSAMPAQEPRGNVRTLPFSGRSAEEALERLQDIWPAMRANPIRVVTPSALIPAMRPGSANDIPAVEGSRGSIRLEGSFTPGAVRSGPSQPAVGTQPPINLPEGRQPLPQGYPLPGSGYGPGSGGGYNRPGPPQTQPPQSGYHGGRPGGVSPPRMDGRDRPANDQSTALPAAGRVIFASQLVDADEPAEDTPADSPSDWPAETTAAPPVETPPSMQPAVPADPPEVVAPVRDPTAPIIVTFVPGGMMIACEDTEALDEFEDLLYTLTAGDLFDTEPKWAIFYLKHTTSSVVAETLDAILGGGTIAGASSGGGGGMCGLMGSLMGGGGGMLGSLLGMGGGGGGSITPSGSMQITSDARLNALIVQALPTDLDMIEELLKILDQKEGPEDVLVRPKTKMIELYNTSAALVAEKVQELYKAQMSGSSQGGGGRQPSPQEFLQALRGGGGRGGGGGSSQRRGEEPQKMAITVFEQTNSVLLMAPEPLFTQIESLITDLDAAAMEIDDSLELVRLKHVSPETVQRALSVLMGSSVQFGQTAGRSSSRPTTGGSPSTPSGSADADARRAAFIEMIRRSQGSGGGSPGMPSRGGGPSRGGPSGGSFRGGPPGSGGGRPSPGGR